jgi:hypothetical protein
VLHVPTNQGKLFFKATAQETIYEAALTQSLSRWFPDCMPEFVSVDTGRGWMLMRDGGQQLRASIRPTQDITPWKPPRGMKYKACGACHETCPPPLTIG